MSPGGSTWYSRRNRPELPPSSVTVTIAVRSEIGLSARSFFRRERYSFNPRSTVERPVPPPSATMRTGRGRFCDFFLTALRGRILRNYPFRAVLTGRAVSLGIQQFCEARVFLQESKILIIS